MSGLKRTLRRPDLIEWTCPQCGETNLDFQDDYTHCVHCGEVVWVLNEDGLIDDQHWKVPKECLDVY